MERDGVIFKEFFINRFSNSQRYYLNHFPIHNGTT